jgi:membrane protease YdiL (CAAX protease family)
MGKNKGRKLGSHAIRLNHLMLMLAAVVPLAVFSGALYQMASTVFDWLTEGSQLAKSIKDMDTNKVMRDLGKDASIWMLLPLIAVAPAISEELIFRGVIGRGLIARHGLVVGVLITTFLFAAVHVNPPHVVAVIPLGLFMHYLYITTRSFWAPVLFHFLNNGLSTIMLKLTSDIDVNVLQEQETVPVYGFLFACVPIALIAITLWKSRVKFETHSGDEWTPGYVSTERPPNDGSAIEATQPPPAGLMISSLVLGGLLIAGYVVAAQEIMEQAPQ